MIHVGALANLALHKFKAGTISIWQRRGSGLVLGGVRCGVLAASLPHGTRHLRDHRKGSARLL